MCVYFFLRIRINKNKKKGTLKQNKIIFSHWYKLLNETIQRKTIWLAFFKTFSKVFAKIKENLFCFLFFENLYVGLGLLKQYGNATSTVRVNSWVIRL